MLGWVALFITIMDVMWPVALLILGESAYGTIPLEVALPTIPLLVGVFLPVFWAAGPGIGFLFTVTMEVFSRD